MLPRPGGWWLEAGGPSRVLEAGGSHAVTVTAVTQCLSVVQHVVTRQCSVPAVVRASRLLLQTVTVSQQLLSETAAADGADLK